MEKNEAVGVFGLVDMFWMVSPQDGTRPKASPSGLWRNVFREPLAAQQRFKPMSGRHRFNLDHLILPGRKKRSPQDSLSQNDQVLRSKTRNANKKSEALVTICAQTFTLAINARFAPREVVSSSSLA